MNQQLDMQQREFLQQLQRCGRATIALLCEAMQVTATAVRQRLNNLEALGFVERETVRGGRGRPSFEYLLTPQGRRALGDNYADLANILWTELRNIDNQTVRKQVLAGVRQALIKRYGPRVMAESVPERVSQLKDALEEGGFHVEVDANGQLPILRENQCPYLDLAEADPLICELEQEVFSQVLGTDVQLTQCCLDGHHCCEFEAAT